MISASMLQRRDAAADQQAAAAAAMAAWSAGIAYAINFIVLYLTMSLTVVVVVGTMGCLASDRIRKSPTFIILVLATALCICAVGVDVTMYKDLVVNPQKPFSANLYTTVVALFLGKSIRRTMTSTQFSLTSVEMGLSSLFVQSHSVPRRLCIDLPHPRLLPPQLDLGRGTSTVEEVCRHRLPGPHQGSSTRLHLSLHRVRPLCRPHLGQHARSHRSGQSEAVRLDRVDVDARRRALLHHLLLRQAVRAWMGMGRGQARLAQLPRHAAQDSHQRHGVLCHSVHHAHRAYCDAGASIQT